MKKPQNTGRTAAHPASSNPPLEEHFGEGGQSRRRFLKLAGSAAALGAGLAAFPLTTGKILAAGSDFVIESGFPASGVYLSPVRAAGSSYHAVGSYWEVFEGDATGVKLSLRASQDGVNFGDWLDCPSDTYEGPVIASRSRYFGRLQFMRAPYLQFKLEIPAGTTVKLAGLALIEAGEHPAPAVAQAETQAEIPLIPVIIPLAPAIINRAGWGADEKLRFGSLGEIWPPEYRYAKVIVVHHSDTGTTNDDDPAKDVRAIYRYHAITQGWGDIGYNFLIDWKGNIYEGRYGGPNVVGGHAYQYNYGSIGVCLLGDFEAKDPTTEQFNALARLLAYHVSTDDIDPFAETFFIDKTVKTICGHRDVINTACPGTHGYAILPALRQKVAEMAGQTVANIELKSLSITPQTVALGESVKIEAVVTNTGSVPLETQAPNPNFTYEEGQSFVKAALPKEDGKFRLGVDFSGNQGVSYLYRWGLGETLAPGATATITGFIKMKNYGTMELFGGLVQENVKFLVENAGNTRIRTVAAGPNRTERAASRASEPETWYFNETGHNIRGAFLKYWQQYGGIDFFGLPLTEEFEEASDTEPGKTYLVQYFERNRFEYHPEFKGTKNEVLLGLLGVQLTSGQEFALSTPFRTTANTIYFKETRHSLGGTFYKYWKAHGGLPIFGYPISEETDEKNPDDGKTYLVQYFERNRFEYHPEFKGTKYEVLLGLLGTELCRRKGWIAS